MDWQDELRGLDADLSAGRIRPDEYRRRRDELLAAASSSPTEIGRVQRKPGQPIGNAFAQNARMPDTSAETTQRVNYSDAEQAKQGWQVLQPAPLAREPIEPQQRPPGDPLSIFGASPPPMHGSEVFASGAAAPRRTWLRFVIALVVLVVIAGLTWWFALRPSSSDSVATPDAPQQQAPAGDAQLMSVEKVPNPTDLPLTTTGVLTVDQAQLYNMIKPDEAGYLAAAGTEKIYLRAVTNGNLNYVLFVFQTGGGTGGQDLAKKIIDRNTSLGMGDGGLTGLPAGVTALTVVGERTTLSEAVYGNGKYAVRIVIQQASPGDRGQLNNAMRRSIDLFTKSISPK